MLEANTKNIPTMFFKPNEHLRNLQLLEYISQNSNISQRKLSQLLGIALGMTNACLKKMIEKGLVKVKGSNHRRVTYSVTPKGLSEKTKLAYHFLEHNIKYYNNLKDNISAKLSILSQEGHRRIICYGAGEVMEVVFVILNESKPELLVLGIVDDDKVKQGKKIFGFEVRHPETIKELKPDAVLITSLKYKDKIISKLNNNPELAGTTFYSI